MSSDILVVYVSIPRNEASRFARELVDRRLAACVNIIPRMESFYRWDGKVLEDSEALLLVKTTSSRMADLERYVVENHPYEMPELIGIPVTAGFDEYLNWVKRETE